MSHHIYTTPGFIVLSRPYGESGKFFLIFTRDLGMIGATAQGVRLSQSKLRYHIQDYSYGLFSLVRGKEVWRLTGAKDIAREGSKDVTGDMIGQKIVSSESKKLHVRVLSLLKRLLHGEEKNERLFEIIHAFYTFLDRENSSEGNDILGELIEYVTVLRILHCLGYISNKNDFGDLVSDSVINEKILDKVKSLKSKIVKEINNALKESQL